MDVRREDSKGSGAGRGEEAEEVTIIVTYALTRRDVDFTITPPAGNHVVSIVPANGHPTGGDLVSATLTLDTAAGSGGSEVLLSSSNTAIATVPAAVTVTEGNTTATFDIDTDAVMGTADVVLTAVYGGATLRKRITVLPTPTTVALDSVSIVPTTFSGENAAGTVTLTAAAPAGGIEVALSGSRAGLATVPSSVTVLQGETTAGFTVTTEVSSRSHNVVVTAAYEGIERSATLLIIYGVEARSPRTDRVTAVRAPAPHRQRTRRITVTAPVRTTRRSTRPADVVATTVDPPRQRFSFYTPELNLMAETELTTDAAPAVQWEYVWFAGQPVAQIETATGEIAWYFNDHLGTPILQTDDTATTIWRVEREPFGKIYTTRTGASRHQPLAFPGQEEAGETSYNIHRWYRSGWGRYTQADPIGLEGGGRFEGDVIVEHPETNLYRYARNNPFRFVDPSGLRIYPPGFVGPIQRHDVISNAGAPYLTMDAAAVAALNEICATSVREDREYAGRIYLWDQQTGAGMYYYSVPIQGNQHGVAQNPIPPSGSYSVGDYHSHGAESGPQVDDENFSPLDIGVGNVHKSTSYIVTPSGLMKKHQPTADIYAAGTSISLGRCRCRWLDYLLFFR